MTEYGEFEILFYVELDESFQEIDYFNNRKHTTHTNINLDIQLSEDFETGEIPICWSNFVEAGNTDWNFQSTYTTAHTGEYFAYIKKNQAGDQITKLVTHKLNLSDLNNPVLKFWHQQNIAFYFQNILKVYYKNSYEGEWQLLQEYADEITDWTEQTIILPETSDDSYIAFEGDVRNGAGICIDDVLITENTGVNIINSELKIYPNPTKGILGYPRKVGLLIITKLQGTLKVPCNCPTLRG